MVGCEIYSQVMPTKLYPTLTVDVMSLYIYMRQD